MLLAILKCQGLLFFPERFYWGLSWVKYYLTIAFTGVAVRAEIAVENHWRHPGEFKQYLV
ncbi:hypothetical protein Pan258_43150 [Symmachiella dynata]|nr:hypothetical protein Pan258_43150 [Symmachiella dynata]